MVHSDEIKFKRMLIERPGSKKKKKKRPGSIHIFEGIDFNPESQNYHQSR